MQVAGKVAVVVGGGNGIEANRFHVFVGKDPRLLDVLVRLVPRRATRLIQRQIKNLLG